MVERLAALGHFGTFAARVAVRSVTPPWEFDALAGHIWALWWRCLPPVLATTTPLGMVMALQGLQIFDLYGAQRLLSPLVSVATFRELSPVLASVLVAAQGGSSFAAELGAMRISEEIDATEVMAIDSLRVHVVPRFLAVLITCPLLNLAGSLGGIFGGYVSAVLIKGETAGIYWSNLWDMTTTLDVFGGYVKATCFGAIIGLVACYFGYHARGGAPGVGRAVNDTVVVAATSFIVVNYFLTTALFGAIG